MLGVNARRGAAASARRTSNEKSIRRRSPAPQPPVARSPAMIDALSRAIGAPETSRFQNIGRAKYGPLPVTSPGPPPASPAPSSRSPPPPPLPPQPAAAARPSQRNMDVRIPPRLATMGPAPEPSRIE